MCARVFCEKVKCGWELLGADLLFTVDESMIVHCMRGEILYLENCRKSPRRVWMRGVAPSMWIRPCVFDNICNCVWKFAICIRLATIEN